MTLAVVSLVADVASAFTNAGDVLGFENAADWSTTTSGATLALSNTHNQGSFSLAVHPSNSNGWTPLFSVPLATLSAVGNTAAIDVMLPMQQANPYWFGAVQMYINCPSHNIYSAYLAQVELTGKSLGVWNTLTFPLTGSEVSSLLASGYSDLTFEVVLNVAVPTTGTYLFDNLRFLPIAANGCGGQPNGALCSDSNACTQTDTCQNGTCVGSNFLACGDDNACTADSCDSVLGCVHTALPCSTRSGQIEAESFNVANAVTATSTCVTPSSSGAWIQFNNVDFGPAGTVGRFNIDLIDSPGNHHITLHLDSPTGLLIADLFSLPSVAISPVPQATDFLVPQSGIHNVVLVFDSVGAGCLDWFLLTPAQGKDTVADFPPTFHHTNPGQQVDLTNLTIGDDEPSESDVPPVSVFTPSATISLAPHTAFTIPIKFTLPNIVIGQARWSGAVGNIAVGVLDLQGNVLATGGSSPIPGGWRADVTTPPLPAQEVVVVFSNAGDQPLSSVQVFAGGVQ